MKQSEIKRNKRKSAEPIKTLPTRKVVKDKDKVYYYFEILEDSIQPRFAYASEFSNYSGVWMAIVQKENNSPYQMFNIYGELSDQGSKNLAEMQTYVGLRGEITFGGHEIRPKRFKDSDGFYFILPNGTQTKRFEWATEFEDVYWINASIVKMDRSGEYRVLNTKGELSENHFSGKLAATKMIMNNLINFSESALITESSEEVRLRD